VEERQAKEHLVMGTWKGHENNQVYTWMQLERLTQDRESLREIGSGLCSRRSNEQ